MDNAIDQIAKDLALENLEIISFVDKIILNAIDLAASDIHFEPLKNFLRIRFRLDGLLVNKYVIPEKFSLEIISRLKVIANLNIAEKRFSQDGKFSINYKNYDIDFRLSSFPSINGEKVVIRILNRNHNFLSLENLGFEQDILIKLKQVASSSVGFFLVTGPTGSGKTTTLHAMLNFVNAEDKNICTLEDPVEYYVDGIMQGQVNHEIGFTFDRGLRAILRQDPDIIMVGEIRDKETAKVAINAALTGHFVLSTLHTNDTVSAIMRLIDMQIEPFLISSAISGILAQRLVRKVCEHCKYQSTITQEESLILKKLSLSVDFIFKSKGCDYCFQTGYKGRLGICELLIFSEDLKVLISKSANTQDIYNQAVKDGTKSLLLDGANKLISGTTSLSEVMRVLL